MQISPHIIAFEHEINSLKVRGDKNHVDENVSEHGSVEWYVNNVNSVGMLYGCSRFPGLSEDE